MTVAYISNGGGAGAGGTSVTANVPASVANGDLLIAILFGKSQSAAFPTQTGWTNSVDYQGSYPCHLGVFYRRASSEPASYTFTAGAGSVYTSAIILRITGAVTSGNPFDAIGSGSDVPGTSTNAVAAAITTVTANTLALQFLGLTDGSLTVTSYPAGYTGVGAASIDFAYKTFAATGSTGTATTTLSANAAGATVLGAIKPAAGGTAYTLTAAQGSFALTGESATLTETTGTNYTLNAATGFLTLTGEAAARDLTLPASEGSFALTGYAAHAAYGMAAANGAFALTGFPATLRWSGAPALRYMITKWVPFDFACRLRSLQRGGLNVGNTQQNKTNLYNLAVTEANSNGVWAKWRSTPNATKTHSNLQLFIQGVPGYVPPAGTND